MFYALVFVMCNGASSPVGEQCAEYVIDKHATIQQCEKERQKRINAARVLFKGNRDWIIQCEKTEVIAK